MLLKFLLCFAPFVVINAEISSDTLVYVHLLFRHGDRCPEKNNLYKSSPYYNESYFKPYGFGQLTNKGKLRSYNVGKEIRARYKGFLDEEYSIDLIDARSSDFNRTKASLQAMLAGLFPPTEELNWLPGFNWQPIPTTYVERSRDKEMFAFGCPMWDATLDEYSKTQQDNETTSKYDDLLKFLTEKTGENYDFLNAYYLYFGFKILQELNYTLPDWGNDVYPYPLKNLTLDYYDMITATSKLRQLTGGYLLKNIVDDVQKRINDQSISRTMSLWCGHENNIAALLKVMKVPRNDDIASYGSYIAMEVHRVNGTYGFQVLYRNKEAQAKVLKLPGCEEFCPMDSFMRIVREDLPVDDSVCEGAHSSTTRHLSQISILVLLILHYCIHNYSK
ncbi:unnamed protein product [Phyllotreta striolata]|uniref:acid phosphatase n=1 Tax=Phyllotreta striolata TaxID=444603 RepID=A0A9N9XK65_PHYSR|nr:unnamed protein product [Phyllotreta striolata]